MRLHVGLKSEKCSCQTQATLQYRLPR